MREVEDVVDADVVANDDDLEEEEDDEQALAEELAQDEIDAEDQVQQHQQHQQQGITLDDCYPGSLPVSQLGGFGTVADAGIFGGYAGYGFASRELMPAAAASPIIDALDSMAPFDTDDLFLFEPPSNTASA